MKETNKEAVNNLFVFIFLKDLLEMASMFMDTQLSSVLKINLQVFEDSWYGVFFFPWGMKLTTHLQLVLRSRKRGSIHPLPHTSSWRSA
jgi:hypothetical protein